MAAPWNPPKRAEDFEFTICLEDWNNPGLFKSSATLAAGDFKISKDGGATANLATLPVVEPAAGPIVKIVLSATEMTADKVTIVWADQTSPAEWTSGALTILTTA
jgi:hypothetical protein